MVGLRPTNFSKIMCETFENYTFEMSLKIWNKRRMQTDVVLCFSKIVTFLKSNSKLKKTASNASHCFVLKIAKQWNPVGFLNFNGYCTAMVLQIQFWRKLWDEKPRKVDELIEVDLLFPRKCLKSTSEALKPVCFP